MTDNHGDPSTALLNKYNRPVPRYTSYPPANHWPAAPSAFEWSRALSGRPKDRPVSLYIHLPFCESRCLYCGCNVVIGNPGRGVDYLSWVKREIGQTMQSLPSWPIAEIHFGGGTPNYFSPKQIGSLVEYLSDYFCISDQTELSIELDPNKLSQHSILELHHLGFRRLSFGIQDVNRKVTSGVHRITEMDDVDFLWDVARQAGFASLNVDFMYGLPHQTEQNFKNNIEWILRQRPDRVALFSYAHIPALKPHQRRMDEQALPSSDVKTALYALARQELTRAGYVAIGFDHFALPTDPLAIAANERNLGRTFMGYTSTGSRDVIAFGMSAISQVGGVYVQNPVRLTDYRRAVDGNGPRWAKGYVQNKDDRLRWEIIYRLLTRFEIDLDEVSLWGEGLYRSQLPVGEYFAHEVAQLEVMVADGLLEKVDTAQTPKANRLLYRATVNGRMYIRAVARVFDRFADKNRGLTFSKAI